MKQLETTRNARRQRLGSGALVLVAALLSTPLWAVEADATARANAASSPQAAIPWLSGGVGDEALAEMRKVADAYNVHLLFAGRQGSYLAAVPYTVSRRDGSAVLSGITAGPLLYLKLPPGSYQVAVEIDGKKQTRQLQVPASGPAPELRFVAAGE